MRVHCDGRTLIIPSMPNSKRNRERECVCAEIEERDTRVVSCQLGEIEEDRE